MSMAEVKFALDTSFIRRVNKNLQEKGGGEGGGREREEGERIWFTGPAIFL